MANTALWNVRKRHEWLAKANKKQKMSRRGRVRIGLQAAIDRRAVTENAEAASKELATDAVTVTRGPGNSAARVV